MPSDIFISYAKPDEDHAIALFDLLEAQSLSCWIAARSILPGTEWANAVVQAIDECGLLLVLLSDAANTSDSVAQEIGLAYARRRPILPVRTASVTPTRGMEFYLGSRQYLDAFPNILTEYREAIVRSVRALIAPRTVSPAPAAAAPPDAAETPPESGVASEPITALAIITSPAADAAAKEPITSLAVVLEPPAVREVIGFDLGHGETAVAKTTLDSHAQPKVVSLGGKRSQVSALGFHPQRGFVLGEEAVLDPAVTAVLICFKEPPGRNAMVRQIVGDYLGAYYRALLGGGHIRGGYESHFFVGCPSGWSRDEIVLYEETLSRSGIPRLKVVKESRAALLNVIESGGITKDELKANVLIVDLGSSTTDLTLVTGGTADAPMDFGLELGAALIDKQILEYAVQTHPQREALRAALAHDQTARERCEFLCRRVKEEYFSNESLYQTSRRPASAGMETLDGGIAFFPSVTTRLMDDILSDPLPHLGHRSWIDAFRELLLESRERLNAQACTPAAVVATGGASRMAFVQRICEEVFPQSKFRRDEEPEASIARGLALWGHVYLRTADFEAAVSQIADRQIPEIVARRADDLVQQIAPAAAKALIDTAVRPALVAWQMGAVATIADIEPMIQTTANEWLAGPDFNRVVADAVEGWSRPLQTELNDLTDDVCRRYGIPPGSLSISPELRRVSNPSLNAAESVSSGVIDSMVVALMLAAGALLMFAGPGGWIAGLISGLVGVSGSAAEVRKMNIWKSVRPALLDVDSCTNSMKAKLQGTFEAELTSGGALAEMSARISAELKSVLLERADEVRLLIR